MIKNKAIALGIALVLVSFVLLNISALMMPFQWQMEPPASEEYSVPIASDPSDFVSIWDTTKTSPGSSNSSQVRLPLYDGGEYDFIVYWGDGTYHNITSWNQPETNHTFASEGVYPITITGTITGWRFNNGGDRLKLLDIHQWGCLQLGNLGSYFYGCSNLELITTDNLNLTGTSSLYQAFRDCTNLGSSGNMNGWDTSNVTNMDRMYYKATFFNQPVGNWDVSSVTTMAYMFAYVISFNQYISNWDVSSVTNMSSMFAYARSFNRPIGNWDVSSVTNMSSMFASAYSFNCPIGNWNVSSVTCMDWMFLETRFNQPIGNWNVSNVTTMAYMFAFAFSFNQPLGIWNVSNVTDMEGIFLGVTLSTSNYDNLLLGWSQLSLQTGLAFHGGFSHYSSGAAEEARAYIINTFGWTITDGGLLPSQIIPGYNLALLLGIVGMIGIYIARKRVVGNVKQNQF